MCAGTVMSWIRLCQLILSFELIANVSSRFLAG
jgi:hypothetical protein